MEEIPTLEDGHSWSDYIFDKWREEGLEDQRVMLGHLIHILPQIYETLELFGYNRLARKLEKAVQDF